MTGKELKAFATEIHEDSVIQMRIGGYGNWSEEFDLQAPYIYKTNVQPQKEAH